MTDQHTDDDGAWLRTSQIAAIFRVDSRTVTRWWREGRFNVIRSRRTLGGHRQAHADDLYQLARQQGFTVPTDELGLIEAAGTDPDAAKALVEATGEFTEHVRGDWDPTENHRLCTCGAVWEGGRGGCQATASEQAEQNRWKRKTTPPGLDPIHDGGFR